MSFRFSSSRLFVTDTVFESCIQQGIVAFGSEVEFEGITLEDGNGHEFGYNHQQEM